MKIKYYDSDKLAEIFEMDRREFHRKIKTLIVTDFKEELEEKQIINPDIGLDEKHNIYLSDTNHTVIIATNLNVEDYKN